MIHLTNRFHFAVRLYSDNAQMTSIRGENKEVRYEPQASSVTDVLTTIFYWAVFLSCENLPVFVRYTQKQFAKLC